MISLMSTNSAATAGSLSPQPLLQPQTQPQPQSQQQSQKTQQLTARSTNSIGSKHSHSPLSPNNQPLSPVKLPLGSAVGFRGESGSGSGMGFPFPHSSSSSCGTVIEGNTKQDLSDIKRLVNPPPAVVVVMEAVVVLLTGRASPFEDIR